MSAKTPDEYHTSGYEGVGEFYDLFADNSDVPFYLEYARRMGSPILELAAGTGRVALSLAQEGFEVVALEKSQSMIAQARKKVALLAKDVIDRVRLVEGSMEKFSLGRKFALIIVPNSFGHLLTFEDQVSTIRCVKEHLSDEGIFILDLYPGELQYEHATFEDPLATLPDGRRVIRFGTIESDFQKKLMHLKLRYTVQDTDGVVLKIINVVSSAALIFKEDADRLIQLSGLQIEDEFGDFEKNPYTHDSGRRVFILKRSTGEGY
jgi:SAM-dependent methyltransferase